MTRHGSIVPQSAGQGIGQQTGGTTASDAREARTILAMLCGQDGMRAAVEEHCGARASKFVEEMVTASNAHVTHWQVTGKQLFWLRDIKDKLIERGVL